jgi:hypothetical protein
VSTTGGVGAGGNESSSLRGTPLLLCTPAMRTGGGAGDGEEVPPPGVTAAAPPGRNPRGLAGSRPGKGRGRSRPPGSESPPAKSSSGEGAAPCCSLSPLASRRGSGIWRMGAHASGEAEPGPRSGRGGEREAARRGGRQGGERGGAAGGRSARGSEREGAASGRGRERGESEPLECSTASGSQE